MTLTDDSHDEQLADEQQKVGDFVEHHHSEEQKSHLYSNCFIFPIVFPDKTIKVLPDDVPDDEEKRVLRGDAEVLPVDGTLKRKQQRIIVLLN